jgi:hypothetical protein
MTLDVRLATTSDVDAIREIGRAAWPRTYAFAGQAFVEHGPAAWWSTTAVERGLATTTTLVAESSPAAITFRCACFRLGQMPLLKSMRVAPARSSRAWSSQKGNQKV